jgi:ATP synthase F1 gamma subunit
MNKNKLTEEMAILSSIHTIVETYEEIAAMRMRKVKKSVLQNREFLSGLNEIFQQVEHSYAEEIEALHKGRQRGNSSVPSISNNGKTVHVLLSANTGLYGDLIKKTFSLFVKESVESNSDMAIIGRLGRNLFEESVSARNTGTMEYTYFDLPDSIQISNEIKKIFNFLVQYKNIVVYHGIFRNILSQIPTKSYIARDILQTEMSENEARVECIFEPTIENIVSFFENQILSALFEQSVYESNLSKYASRMISLDYASVNIESKIKSTKYQRKKLNHGLVNSKQLSLMTGMSLWRKNG